MSRLPTVLLILDGWGHNPSPEHNAIAAANTPTWDDIWQNRPHTLISCSGLDVGLPEGQMGNSEVGHMTLGAGRVVWQSLTRIDKAMSDGDFESNQAYTEAIDDAISRNGAIHIMGLLSPGGVHSHEDHITAAIYLAVKRGAKEIYLHAFLDGRDTPPRSAAESIKKVESAFVASGLGRIASLCGRYYAMDRDSRWERIKAAYDLLTSGEAPYQYDNAMESLTAAYARNENDEFVQPTIVGEPVSVSAEDAVIFMNFRADRARQLTRAMTCKTFSEFDRSIEPLDNFVATTEYAADLNVSVAFPPESLKNSFGEIIEAKGLNQLRIAETEKYAHVTFFFSGGRESLYKGEVRELIPSPDVATYDLKPEMSAPELTERLVDAIQSGKYDTIICNYANGDMLGHSGIFDAAVKAVEVVDQCLRKVITAVEKTDAQCLITADHGNVERMLDEQTNQPLTSHTSEPVPLIYIGPSSGQLTSDGTLADIAPTMLKLMGQDIPAEMSGKNLADWV